MTITLTPAATTYRHTVQNQEADLERRRLAMLANFASAGLDPASFAQLPFELQEREARDRAALAIQDREQLVRVQPQVDRALTRIKQATTNPMQFSATVPLTVSGSCKDRARVLTEVRDQLEQKAYLGPWLGDFFSPAEAKAVLDPAHGERSVDISFGWDVGAFRPRPELRERTDLWCAPVTAGAEKK